MPDKIGIYERYFACFSLNRPIDLAKMLKLNPTTIYQWKSGKCSVPRKRLKKLVDAEGLSWDWLLEGIEPKYRPNPSPPPKKAKPFNWRRINKRFLSLFGEMTQEEIGMEVGVIQKTVSDWGLIKIPVPWAKLKYAVDKKGVTWEWLLEGRGQPPQ